MKTGNLYNLKRNRKTKPSKKLKCWEFFRCQEKTCPAYRKRNLRCWLFSGTHCRSEIQGKFLEKMEMCIDCEIFRENMDTAAMQKTSKVFNEQFKEFRRMVKDANSETENLSLELTISLSEVYEALKKISSGDPAVRIPETSEIEVIEKLKHLVNITAENIGEIVDQSHEFAISIAEHSDVLHRVSNGDLNARVSGSSNIELLESLKKVTNETIESISREITERKAVEDALRENEEKYRDLYQKAPDGYHSLGPDATILEVNDTWLRMLGYKREEVVGKMKLTDLLSEDAKKIFEETFFILKEKGSVENMDYFLERKDGSLLPVLINATAIYDENGNFLKSKAIVRDNTHKKSFEKKLKHAAEEWRATFDSMPYGVLLIDTDLTVKRANNFISAMFDIPFKEIIGKKCYELLEGGNKLKEFCNTVRAEEDKSPVISEYYDTRINKYLMLHVSPVVDERKILKNLVLALIDISDIKNKEKRLIESRDAFLNMLKEIDYSYKELKELFNGFIHSFVNAIDAKSPWTKGHSDRVTLYAVSIAKEMGLKESDIENLSIAALLHDIGKIGTYDIVLDKPGKLTEEEFQLIRMHPAKGAEILEPVRQLQNLLPIIRYHHERMDGKGYPDGLKGEEIPLLSRIIALADSFDSMTSDRPYRPVRPMEYAISEIKTCIGTQFDPRAAEAFLRVIDRLHRPQNKMDDNPEEFHKKEFF